MVRLYNIHPMAALLVVTDQYNSSTDDWFLCTVYPNRFTFLVLFGDIHNEFRLVCPQNDMLRSLSIK